ncbi:hypothetical protein AQS70_21045 [Pseudomonas endophytica]|uniref:Uncharacterized protein n=1 Tax=Pseudomonas endophytica TaxID=1563157 RepID=A0A0Q0XVP4_9PSED|nr:hypothetical protein [Pseudomonas endophytica]KQB54713.1 hypothetical protein AQS70_21045 [Pseudomonas endophytica]
MLFENSLKATLLALFAASLGACVPWPRERPAYADLCQSEFEFKVPGETVVLEAYLYDHAALWSDRPVTQALHTQLPGEKVSRKQFYVQLITYNKGRQRPTSSSHGEAPVPILYDSRQAYITFEDGSQLKANPNLYLGDDETYDYPLVNQPHTRPSPYNINSDEVHRRVPRITNNSRYGSVYLIFPTEDFNAQSAWTIHLGALDINGQKVDIPPLKLCHQPVKKWIGIEPLMRP